MNTLHIGTCSWNFPSWKGLVYDTSRRRSADYLPDYAKRFSTAEIDSWFYRIPTRDSVQEYVDLVPEGFRWTCKAPQDITLTHLRSRGRGAPLERNPHFLSDAKVEEFLTNIDPILPTLDACMFEFEYLNQQKVSGQREFMDRLGPFLEKLPREVPFAVETRNANFLNREWFEFLQSLGVAHVFSEKLYLPHIWELVEAHGDVIGSMPRAIIRLLGGDRKAIEAKTDNKWNHIVEDKPADREKIAGVVAGLVSKAYTVLNVNNHYEGSAPITIETLIGMLEERGVAPAPPATTP